MNRSDGAIPGSVVQRNNLYGSSGILSRGRLSYQHGQSPKQNKARRAKKEGSHDTSSNRTCLLQHLARGGAQLVRERHARGPRPGARPHHGYQPLQVQRLPVGGALHGQRVQPVVPVRELHNATRRIPDLQNPSRHLNSAPGGCT